MQRLQTIENKKGEVTFRKSLAKQFEGTEIIYPGEPTQKEYLQIIKDRLKDYRTYFEKIIGRDVPLTPYLELGAGVGQGAMLLENEYHARGFTSDISYETLNLAKKYLKDIGYKKMPIRVCCDVYNLPFRSQSLPFVFTFQTLHHLPDPYPVLKEIKRVLIPGGFFYFNEEPIAQECGCLDRVLA
jgi:ubiquinone/menaquinone biosynthesis C-methylase UbiE